MKKFVLLLFCALLLTLPINASAVSEEYTFLIPPEYTKAENFNSGVARVCDTNGNFGVINHKGERVFGFDGTVFAIRGNGLIMAVGENDKAAFFANDGRQLTDYIYDTYKTQNPENPGEYVYNYVTAIHDGNDNYIPVSRGGKFGYINYEGKEVIPLQYDYADGFYVDVARIRTGGTLNPDGSYTGGTYGYITYDIAYVEDETEVRVTELYPATAFTEAEEFNCGNFDEAYATVYDTQYKTIDRSGTVYNLGNNNYRFVSEYANYIIAANELGETALMRKTNDVYDILIDFDTRSKRFASSNIIIDDKEIVNVENELVYKADENVVLGDILGGYRYSKFIEAQLISEGGEEKVGVISYNGEELLPCEYQKVISPNSESICALDYDGMWHFFNHHGRELCRIDGELDDNAVIDGYGTWSYMPVKDNKTGLYGYISYPSYTEGKMAADFLYNLGLFKGTGVNEDGSVNYALDRNATRVEGLVMLIRALGKEGEALTYPKTHPFTDVPEWADGYVSYAYENGITNGVSGTEFGNNEMYNSNSYLTFMLRALGYSDADGDFEWENPGIFANQCGIQNEGRWGMNGSSFKRSNMADITYHTLYAKFKDTNITLWQKLEAEGVIEKGSVPEEKAPTRTYEQALEKALNDGSPFLRARLDNDICTAVAGTIGGLPHGGQILYDIIITKPGHKLGEGAIVTRLIPNSDGMFLSEDKTKLYHANNGILYELDLMTFDNKAVENN